MSYLPPPSSLPPGSIVDSYSRDSGGMRQDKSTDQQLTAPLKGVHYVQASSVKAAGQGPVGG